MPSASSSLVGVAILLVALVLLLGLANMLRGGSPNRSQHADALARRTAVPRDRRHCRGALVPGTLNAWSGSTASTRAQATTARRASATASGGRSSIRASRAYGEVDELNSAIGVARAATRDPANADLMEIDADAGARAKRLVRPRRRPLLSAQRGRRRGVARDDGAGRGARARDRRAQRRSLAAEIVRAAGRKRGRGGAASGASDLPASRARDRRARGEGETVGAPVIAYMNRLSDYLFVAARFANRRGADDVLWVPGAQSLTTNGPFAGERNDRLSLPAARHSLAAHRKATSGAIRSTASFASGAITKTTPRRWASPSTAKSRSISSSRRRR